MHLHETLRRAQRQPRPSNARPHSALFSATAFRPGRGAVRLECGGLPPTKRVLASFPFSGCVLTFFAICSSNIGRIKKTDSLREKSARGAIQEEASNGNAKIGKLRYQNYSCRLRRLGHRRVRQGDFLGGGGGGGVYLCGSSFSLDVRAFDSGTGHVSRLRAPDYRD